MLRIRGIPTLAALCSATPTSLSTTTVRSKCWHPVPRPQFPCQAKITAALNNACTITAHPCKQDISGLNIADVANTDPSAVGRVANNPSIKIDNKAYIGVDGGKSCGTVKAVNTVTGVYFTDVTYCLNATNTGDIYLDSVVVNDTALAFSQPLTKCFAPGASQLLPLPGTIKANLSNNALSQPTQSFRTAPTLRK